MLFRVEGLSVAERLAIIFLCLSVLCSASENGIASSMAGISAKEEMFFNKLIEEYERAFPELEKGTFKLKKKVEKVVFALNFWVAPEVSARTKQPKSFEAKLKGRLAKSDFQTYDDVLRLMHDKVGIRITCYFPSIEIPQIIKALELNFEIIALRQNLTYDYVGINIHARIDNIDLEIQLRGAFHHAFYQINHKFNYKPKGGPLSRDDMALLEQIRFHAFEAEEALGKLLASRNVPPPRIRTEDDDDNDQNEWNSAMVKFLAEHSGKTLNEL